MMARRGAVVGTPCVCTPQPNFRQLGTQGTCQVHGQCAGCSTLAVDELRGVFTTEHTDSILQHAEWVRVSVNQINSVKMVVLNTNVHGTHWRDCPLSLR